MKYEVDCPCCNGSGDDKYFDLDRCVTCGGEGKLNTEVLGTIAQLEYGGTKISVDEFEEDPDLPVHLWDWVTSLYAGRNWWEVHAAVPALVVIEEALLDAGEIKLSDIPGGPNNPTSPEMKKRAKDLEQALKILMEEIKKQNENILKQNSHESGVAEEMNKQYNSYGERLKAQQAKPNESKQTIPSPVEASKGLRDKIIEKATQAAQATSSQRRDVAASTQKDKTTIEETTMSTSSVTDRLKSGGRSVVDSAKKGALLGTVTAANKGAIDFLEYKLGEKYPDILKTEAGRTAMQLLLPAIIIMVCEIDETGKIPAKEHVRNAAQLAVEGTSADALEAVISFLLSNGTVLLQAYAHAGQEIEKSHQLAETFDAEVEMQRVKVKQKEVVPVFSTD